MPPSSCSWDFTRPHAQTIQAQIDRSNIRELAPQSVGRVLYADGFANGSKDLNAIAIAAFATRSHAPAAVLYLNPAVSYTASFLTLPGAYVAPFIANAVIDCQGATITLTTNGPAAAVTVPPANSFSSASGPGGFRNCTLSRPDRGGPVMQVNSRSGFQLKNVRIAGGSIGFRAVSTTVGVPDGATYSEQLWFDNVSFDGFANRAMSLEVDGNHPGTGSFLYAATNHVKFDYNAGHTGLYIGPGAAIFGGILQFDHQIGGGSADYHLVTVDGQLLSSKLTFWGEDTGAPTGNIYLIDGGYSNATIENFMRFSTGHLKIGGLAYPTANNKGCAVDENSFLGRVGAVCVGSNFTAFLANNGGSENNSAFAVKTCITSNGARVAESTDCYNKFFADSLRSHAVYFGQYGPADTSGTTGTASGQFGPTDASFTGAEWRSRNRRPNTKDSFHYGLKMSDAGVLTEYVSNGTIGKSAVVGGTSGTWFTGKCPAGQTADYVLGRAVGCS